MPISGQGWELHVVRQAVQVRTGAKGHRRVRTVGTYQVFHDGVPQVGEFMSGTIAEAKGPGANRPQGNGRRVEAGRYALATQGGTKYVTHAFHDGDKAHHVPKPGIELLGTDQRREIVIHPGQGFLASKGCLNPCTALPDAAENIGFARSRRRVIDIIADLRAFVGPDFPDANGRPIPRAFAVIDGEP